MKKAVIIAIAALLVTIAAILLAPAYRHVMAGRLLKAAVGARARQDYASASRFYRLALTREPDRLDVLRSFAEFLDGLGHPDVLAARLRISQLAPADTAARLDAVETALKFRKLTIARWLLARPTPDMQSFPRYYDLLGWMQFLSFDLPNADATWAAALAKNPGNKIYEANLATVRLSSVEESVRNEAAGKLEQLAMGDRPPLSALTSLMAFAARSPAEPGRLDRWLERFHELVPMSDPFFTNYLDALRRWRPDRFKETLDAYLHAAQAEPQTAMVALRWMAGCGLNEELLAFRQPLPRPLRENLQSMLFEAEALLNLKRMDALESLLKEPAWNTVQPLKMALQERLRRVSQPADHGTDIKKWNAILTAEGKSDAMLTMLARMAFTWGWHDEYALTLEATAGRIPSAESDALANLFQFYLRDRDARNLRLVLRRQLALQPDNPDLQNNFAFLSFLLGLETEKAAKMIDGLCALHPKTVLYISTRAFGFLKAGQPARGLALFNGIDTGRLRGTAAGVCYGYLLAATGDRAAVDYLKDAEKWTGFPEEIEMVATARRQLQHATP